MIEDLLTPYHLLILFALLFFLFGAQRLPGLGKSLGHGIREFRGGLAGLVADHDDELPEAAADEPPEAANDEPPEAAADEPPTPAVPAQPRLLGAGEEPPRPA